MFGHFDGLTFFHACCRCIISRCFQAANLVCVIVVLGCDLICGFSTFQRIEVSLKNLSGLRIVRKKMWYHTTCLEISARRLANGSWGRLSNSTVTVSVFTRRFSFPRARLEENGLCRFLHVDSHLSIYSTVALVCFRILRNVGWLAHVVSLWITQVLWIFV